MYARFALTLRWVVTDYLIQPSQSSKGTSSPAFTSVVSSFVSCFSIYHLCLSLCFCYSVFYTPEPASYLLSYNIFIKSKMVGKLLGLALAALGAVATLVEKDVTVAQSGNTLTIGGVSTGEIIIIQTNAGGSAQWTNVNPAIATGGQTHVVTVGGTSLVFNPSSIQAAIGDIVEFHYLAKNHSTTQSSFAKPCVNAHQFDAGFVPNPTGMSPPPMIRVQVNTTTPTCKQ